MLNCPMSMRWLAAAALVVRSASSTGRTSLRVAFCFVGQFPRHREMTKPITQFGQGPTYDAFVATSTQHDEEDPSAVVVGRQVCSHLQTQGFSRCFFDLQPYNATEFFVAVQGLEPSLSNRLGLYPHRMVSMFSTWSRALDLLASHEEPGSRYDMIFVTRTDIINLVRFSGRETKLVSKDSWWASAQSHQVVAAKRQCESNKPCMDDRFFFGNRDAMMRFGDLRKKFRKIYHPVDACWPERILHVFAEKHIFAPSGSGSLDDDAALVPTPANSLAPAPKYTTSLKLMKLEPQWPSLGVVADFVDLTAFKSESW